MVRESTLAPVIRALLRTGLPSTSAICVTVNSTHHQFHAPWTAPLRSRLGKHPPRHFTVVKMYDAILQNLIRFVPFSSENYDVARLRFMQSGANGLLAVRLDNMRRVIAPQPNQSVVHDGDWIFRAGIVGRQHHKVAGLARRHAHQWPLGAITVAAAAEKSNDAFGMQFAGHRDYTSQGVIGMRVVHHN